MGGKLLEPPSALSPLLAGLLVNGHLSPEMVTAFLVDLCQRGYLMIIKKQDQYYLTQRAMADEHLESWEREILDQLFPSFGTRISEDNAKSLGVGSVFSPKVRDAFDQIYEVATTVGTFRENPHVTRIRIKLVALLFYFAALVAIGWTVVINSSPVWLIPPIVVLVLAYLTIRHSSKIIHYSAKGNEQRQQWQAFGNFLGSRQPLGLAEAQNHTYERYLAYAIALHRGREWASRFDIASTVINRPSWFVSYEEIEPGQLAKELVSFTNIISSGLTKMHGPLVG